MTSEARGPTDRALALAGSLGSTKATLSMIGLLGFAALAVTMTAMRSDDVVTSIERADDPAAVAATPGGPTDGPAGPSITPSASAAAKRAFATPDELDGADSPEKLTKLAETYPDDPAVQKRLAIAFAAKNDHSSAIRAVRKLARLAPAMLAEDAIHQVVLRAANGTPDVMELAFDLMEDGMGPAGAELLYTIAITDKMGKMPRERAEKALLGDKVRKNASPALLIAIDLRSTKSPCERKKLFVRARDEGDTRSLPYLTPLLSSDGCGFLRTGDCYKCLGGRGDLREAVTAIQARDKK
jgi:hypothetical protein